MGWALVPYEELNQAIKDSLERNSDYLIKPDFALFDVDKAVSIFNTSEPRTFEVVFNTGTENSTKVIREQHEMYAQFLENCWIANNLFEENAKYDIGDNQEAILKSYQKRKARIEDKLNGFNFESDKFAFLVKSPDEVREKLTKFKGMMDDYHVITGRSRKAAGKVRGPMSNSD
jgi:hypothetical protein